MILFLLSLRKHFHHMTQCCIHMFLLFNIIFSLASLVVCRPLFCHIQTLSPNHLHYIHTLCGGRGPSCLTPTVSFFGSDSSAILRVPYSLLTITTIAPSVSVNLTVQKSLLIFMIVTFLTLRLLLVMYASSPFCLSFHFSYFITDRSLALVRIYVRFLL